MPPPLGLTQKIAFFHVMKTGGITFREMLRAIYGNSFHISNPNSIDELQSELERFDCVEYHMVESGDRWDFAHKSLMPGRRWDLLEGREVFTMLRDPVDRYVSQYYYMLQLRAQVERQMNARGMAFPESILAAGAPNEQVGFLAAKSSRWDSTVDRSDLELAKEMLLSLRVHVGLMERFADSMNVFETVTGISIPGGIIQIQNKNSRRKSLSTLSGYLRDRIRERNELDFELYEFGKELFLEDFARCKPTRTYSFLPPPQSAPDARTTVEKRSGSAESHTGVQAVVFDVPMTRGDTFRRHIARMFGESYHMCDDPSVEAIAAQLAQFRCVEFTSPQHGVDFVPIHGELLKHHRWDLLEGKQIFLLLREPVECVILRYHMMVQVRPFLEPRFVALGMTFPETLEEFIEQPITQNSQLGFLTGKLTALTSQVLDRADLETMKDLFVRLGVHVGLTDRFDDSLRVLQVVTGQKLLASDQNLDRYPPCPPLDTIPAATIARIKELNALDLELYELGKQLFLDDLKRYDLEKPEILGAPPKIAEQRGLWAAIPSVLGRAEAN